MKKDMVEYLSFDDDDKAKVGRPKLADKKTKKKSIIIASISFVFVILLLIFGYGTLFGFKNLDLRATATKNETSKNVLVEEIKPLVKDITLKAGTARKAYLTVLPASANNKKIKYESSDESVASVDNDGKIVGVSVGNVIITATTTDGSNLKAEFNVKVIKNAEGKCLFTSLVKTSNGVSYTSECNNAKIKEIQYKIGNDNFESLLTKKMSDEVKFSSKQLEKDITFKVVYYPNNSKMTKYETKTIKQEKKTTTQPSGSCVLQIKEVKANAAKYDISCDNATVTKIAYKIGNGSYVGIDSSNLADTVLYEESDVTRVIYFSVEYKIDGTEKIKTLSKSSIVEKKITTTNDR